MKKAFFLITLVTVSLFAAQCRKVEEPQAEGTLLGVVRLSEEERDFVPYQMGDLLFFQNQQSATIVYEVVDQTIAVGGTVITNPETDDFYNIESMNVRIADAGGNIYNIHHTPALNMEYDRYFSISLGVSDSLTTENFNCTYGCDGDTLESIYGGQAVQHGSIYLNSENYLDVYEFVGQSNSGLPASIAKVYYNQKYGIVGFVTITGEVWNLMI